MKKRNKRKRQKKSKWLYSFDVKREIESEKEISSKNKDGDDEVQDASEFYRFVRIGEETDDNEVQGWGFDIHIERSATY